MGIDRGAGLVVGLDLHGTLLEPGELILPEKVEPVAMLLRRLRGRADAYICTGNDLDFVKRKVPAAILEQVSGYVLETGCSTSPDGAGERVLTREAERDDIAALEALLRECAFEEVNYFAHRLTTISMFCDDPRAFHAVVSSYVNKTRFGDKVHVTYSSVAVDILPAGYNKAKGLKMVADGRKTLGVADSMNDKALLAEADYAFAPSNMAPELEPVLSASGRRVVEMAEASGLIENAVIRAAGMETEGVVEILRYLDKALPR